MAALEQFANHKCEFSKKNLKGASVWQFLEVDSDKSSGSVNTLL